MPRTRKRLTYVGKPCKLGHVIRCAKEHRCVECKRLYALAQAKDPPSRSDETIRAELAAMLTEVVRKWERVFAVDKLENEK